MKHRFLISPGWLVRHALVVVLFVAFLALGWWQISRAENGNMRSYGYAAEWPLFAGFLIFFWVRIIRIEIASRERRAADEQRAADDGVALPAGPTSAEKLEAAFNPWGRSAPQQPTRAAIADPEMDAYNAYLAGLAAQDSAAKPRR